MIGAEDRNCPFPCVSRSGMTITTSLALGLERVCRRFFIFNVHTPILGAALLDGIDAVKEIQHL